MVGEESMFKVSDGSGQLLSLPVKVQVSFARLD